MPNNRDIQRCSSLGGRVTFLFILAVCAFLSGCAGATRLPARSRGQGGATPNKSELDLTFLDSSTVHRTDVANKLTQIDTGCQDPQLFWGRWAESKWGYWWAVAGKRGEAAADAKRIWRIRNLLITFDERGILQSKQLIEDDLFLWRQLHEDIARRGSADFSKIEGVTLEGKLRSMSLSFTPLGLELVDIKKGRFVITPERLVRFRHIKANSKRQSVNFTCHELYFSEKTQIGDHVVFCGSAPQILATFQYLNHIAPKNMEWE